MQEPADLYKDLDTRRWNLLEDLAARLEAAWKVGGPVDLQALLPPADDPLRPLALAELIKVDMECRWTRSQPVVLDQYAEKYPELGPKRGLAAELIFEEYRLRHRFGDKPTLALYQQRFPAQFDRLQE